MSVRHKPNYLLEDKMSTEIINRPNSAIDAVMKEYMDAYEGDVEFAKLFEDVTDFKFAIDSNMEYSGVTILTPGIPGEPRIFVNTAVGEFQAYYGSDTAIRRQMPYTLMNAIDEYYSKLYDSMK